MEGALLDHIFYEMAVSDLRVTTPTVGSPSNGDPGSPFEELSRAQERADILSAQLHDVPVPANQEQIPPFGEIRALAGPNVNPQYGANRRGEPCLSNGVGTYRPHGPYIENYGGNPHGGSNGSEAPERIHTYPWVEGLGYVQGSGYFQGGYPAAYMQGDQMSGPVPGWGPPVQGNTYQYPVPVPGFQQPSPVYPFQLPGPVPGFSQPPPGYPFQLPGPVPGFSQPSSGYPFHPPRYAPGWHPPIPGQMFSVLGRVPDPSAVVPAPAPQPPQQTTQNAGKRRYDEVAQGGSGAQDDSRKTHKKKKKSAKVDPNITKIEKYEGNSKEGKIRGVIQEGSIVHKLNCDLLLVIWGCKPLLGNLTKDGPIHIHGIGNGDAPTNPLDKFIVFYDGLVDELLQIQVVLKGIPAPPMDLIEIIHDNHVTYRRSLQSWFLDYVNACTFTVVGGASTPPDLGRMFICAAEFAKSGKITQLKVLTAMGLMALSSMGGDSPPVIRYAEKTFVLKSMGHKTIPGNYANWSTSPTKTQPAVLIEFTRCQFVYALCLIGEGKPFGDVDEKTQNKYKYMLPVEVNRHENHNTKTDVDWVQNLLGTRSRDMERYGLTGVYFFPILHLKADREKDRFCLVITYPLKKPET